MRTYGRNAEGKWVKIETDEAGFNDAIWLTTLVQNLRLHPEESPFFSENGVASYGSVIQQILPTYYVNKIQQEFAQYFTTLQIALVTDDPPTYSINALTKAGSKIISEVAG